VFCTKFVNRRIRNRTYGGVGGRGLDAPFYLIQFTFDRKNTSRDDDKWASKYQ